jgi:hypothetical protein
MVPLLAVVTEQLFTIEFWLLRTRMMPLKITIATVVVILQRAVAITVGAML